MPLLFDPVDELAVDSPALADLATSWKSAYVHVPFCRRRCPYCDFAIVDESTRGGIDHTEYVTALLSEIAMESDFGPLTAINFGGGTPSRLAPLLLTRVIERLQERFGVTEAAEISLEVNPEDWSSDLAPALVDAGFTRISIGAQSFDPTVLAALGRLHTAEMTRSVVASARSVGIASIGIDLIFGHPRETADSWERTVEHAMNLGVDHISTYSLTVELGTELSRQVNAGAPAPDDDVQADRYLLFGETSKNFGYTRYEISNHAMPGHACRYNLATWAHGEYVAFGIGAHDHRWGERARNHQRPDRYLEAIARGERPRIGIETLTPGEQERDRLILGLRLAAGTPLTATARQFVSSIEGRKLRASGLLEVAGGRLRVLKPMLTDTVLREALSVSPLDC